MNYKATVNGNTLTITVDLSKRLGPSKSGKSEVIATTSGNKSMLVDGKEIKLGLNVYTEAGH